jgi:hypothetical protein
MRPVGSAVVSLGLENCGSAFWWCARVCHHRSGGLLSYAEPGFEEIHYGGIERAMESSTIKTLGVAIRQGVQALGMMALVAVDLKHQHQHGGQTPVFTLMNWRELNPVSVVDPFNPFRSAWRGLSYRVTVAPGTSRRFLIGINPNVRIVGSIRRLLPGRVWNAKQVEQRSGAYIVPDAAYDLFNGGSAWRSASSARA